MMTVHKVGNQFSQCFSFWPVVLEAVEILNNVQARLVSNLPADRIDGNLDDVLVGKDNHAVCKKGEGGVERKTKNPISSLAKLRAEILSHSFSFDSLTFDFRFTHLPL